MLGKGWASLSFPQVASTFLAKEAKKEILFCQEVDFICKSADRNETHTFSANDIPQRSVLWSLPETSSTDK